MNTKRIIPFHIGINIVMSSLFLMIISLIILPGCAPVLKDIDSTDEAIEEAPLRTQPVPVYYDFDDISIPSELKLDKKKSYIYETPTTKNGILVFKGRVDVNSLVSFFKESMPKDNWILITSYKYKDYILNFQKDDRNCLITLYDKLFNTVVEVRVGSSRK